VTALSLVMAMNCAEIIFVPFEIQLCFYYFGNIGQIAFWDKIDFREKKAI
jgi:hypothetical protein